MSNAHAQAQQIWERFLAADTQLGMIAAGQGAHGDVSIEHVDRELLGALAVLPDAEARVEVCQLRGTWIAYDHVLLDGTAITLTLRASARPARPSEVALATRSGGDSAIIPVSGGALCLA